MHLDRYPLVSNDRHDRYEFLSKGPQGIVKKVVLYEKLAPNIYNLAFGDWNEQEQTVDDTARTNNEDRNKILATIAATVTDFIEHHPGSTIFAEGSTPARTRLYQMSIAAHWYIIGKQFNIRGYCEDWEPFKPGKNYTAFALYPSRIL